MGIKRNTNKTEHAPLLEVKDFSLTFRQYGKGLRERELEVIRRFNLTVYPGEIVAVIGASGSGKSLLANAVLGILPNNAQTKGVLNYRGKSLSRQKQKALRGKEISLIPQSVNALDPLMKTGKQVQSVIKDKNKHDVRQTIFRKMGLNHHVEDLYPFELSGGMSRRVLTAMAMVSGASLVIADEPTPGLDPKVLQETLNYLKQLATEEKGIMFITHDIEVALTLADKIAIFNEGETVEVAHAHQFTGKGEQLQHPYTRALWNALPQNAFLSDLHDYSPRKVSERSITSCAIKPHSHNKTCALEVKHLSFHYPNKRWLFKNLNLSVSPGEIVGLFGYSGSGKSTMAQIMSGYKMPNEGRVLIDGQALSTAIHPVQLVWQHPEKGINPRWRLKKVLQEASHLDSELMTLLGIKSEWLNRWPSELSGGELQRFCLARALAAENIKYLIADEMTTMLDAVTQAQIWHVVMRLAKERNIGVLAISHNHKLLQRISDRVINFTDLI